MPMLFVAEAARIGTTLPEMTAARNAVDSSSAVSSSPSRYLLIRSSSVSAIASTNCSR